MEIEENIVPLDELEIMYMKIKEENIVLLR
jgi:hypothetical protein